MSFLAAHIQINKKAESAIYLQIANQVITVIQRGVLTSGTKLPGTRMLAEELNVHRKTVVWAYDEMIAQGWLESFPRKGIFVAQHLPEVKPRKLSATESANEYPAQTVFQIQNKIVEPSAFHSAEKAKLIFDAGFPDTRLAPVDLLMREFRSISRKSAFRKSLMYGDPQGSIHLRNALASHLRETRGLQVKPENILITNGAQMGIYLAASMLLKKGDAVIVGEPGYYAANLTFEQVGGALHKVTVDENGLDIDAVERLCKKKKIRMLYVIPHHHLPTTVTLSPDRRMRLLELARRYKFAILEDDYDFDLHYDFNPVLPMASQDQGNVLYIGTLTKIFAPSIRIGFLIAPESFIKSATALRRIVDRQGDTIIEEAIAALYANGTISRHIKKVRKIYGERRNFFCDLLTNEIGHHISFKKPQGGMSVWTTFNELNVKAVSAHAIKKGLLISDGSLYNLKGKNYNSTRMGFASLNLKELEEATGILKSVVKKM